MTNFKQEAEKIMKLQVALGPDFIDFLAEHFGSFYREGQFAAREETIKWLRSPK